MPQIELDETIFMAAQRQALSAGYPSVDAYVADVVVHASQADADNADHVFTPHRIAELENISAEIKAGGVTHSLAEVREHFENKRKAWLAKHAS
jgi:hypothetical protein